jgi:hypothetical protein
MKILQLFCALIMLAALTQPAEARRRGDTHEAVDLVAKLPEKPEFSIDGMHVDLGYMFKETTVLNVPVWAEESSRQFVLYAKDADGVLNYLPLGPSEIAAVTKELGKDPTKDYSFAWWKHAWGLLLLIPLILYGVYTTFFGKKDEEEEPVAN